MPSPSSGAPAACEIGGFADPGFGPVADAFRANFDRGELGASVALYVDGRPVVDLWGGVASRATRRPWDRDTVAVIFSATKGIAAICAHMLVERNQLDLDAPVTTYWPAFAAAGKGATTVRHVLTHRSGLPVIDGPVTLDDLADPDAMARRVAHQAPIFEPGTSHLYQAITFSWVFGEIFRRAAGETVGAFVAREVARPLRADLWIGLPPQIEEHVAPIEPLNVAPELVAMAMPEDGIPWRTLTLNGVLPLMLVGPASGLNDPRLHRLELPAVNAITNARSLARIYAATVGEVDGVRLLHPDTVAEASIVRSEGQPFGGQLGGPRWGTGFLRPFPRVPMLGGASFGHDGTGGSLGFAEPTRAIAFGHVVNQMLYAVDPDERTAALLHAVRACIDR